VIRRVALPLLAMLLVAANNPNGGEWTVESGDTLRGIANRTGVSLSVIAAANGIAEPYDVRVGQKLVIPRQRSHLVKSGETLSGIAERYGVPSSQIAIANSLPASRAVRTGQRLIIPAVLPESATAAPTTPGRPHFARPHDGAVLLGWARRPDGGGHDGIDFAVRTGDMIRASASGTVIFAGPGGRRFGTLVVVDHGNGWHTAYGNLARATVKAGDPIKAGERLGIGGLAGAATQPEVHFEVRQGDKPVDPAPLLGID
jgi:murein DD-endopeptidase MepM/ murein hydrolase activator NlpD